LETRTVVSGFTPPRGSPTIFDQLPPSATAVANAVRRRLPARALAITPTNLLYNVFATPGALLRLGREGRLHAPLAGLLVAGTLPGVIVGAIDEYRLVVHPVVLGAGERLFATPLAIEPVSTIAFSGGAVGHVFTARP
jgi:hypothetical protein